MCKHAQSALDRECVWTWSLVSWDLRQHINMWSAKFVDGGILKYHLHARLSVLNPGRQKQLSSPPPSAARIFETNNKIVRRAQHYIFTIQKLLARSAAARVCALGFGEISLLICLITGKLENDITKTHPRRQYSNPWLSHIKSTQNTASNWSPFCPPSPFCIFR